MTLLLRPHLTLSDFTVDDVVDTRIAIERAAVRAAGKAAVSTGFGALEGALVAIHGSTLATHRFHEHDTQFHVTIGVVSGNHCSPS